MESKQHLVLAGCIFSGSLNVLLSSDEDTFLKYLSSQANKKQKHNIVWFQDICRSVAHQSVFSFHSACSNTELCIAVVVFIVSMMYHLSCATHCCGSSVRKQWKRGPAHQRERKWMQCILMWTVQIKPLLQQELRLCSPCAAWSSWCLYMKPS